MKTEKTEKISNNLGIFTRERKNLFFYLNSVQIIRNLFTENFFFVLKNSSSFEFKKIKLSDNLFIQNEKEKNGKKLFFVGIGVVKIQL